MQLMEATQTALPFPLACLPLLSCFAGRGTLDVFGEVCDRKVVPTVLCGLEHVEEPVCGVGLFVGERDFMLFATVDDVFGILVGKLHEVLFVRPHLLDGLLGFVDHFVDLNRGRLTGT